MNIQAGNVQETGNIRYSCKECKRSDGGSVFELVSGTMEFIDKAPSEIPCPKCGKPMEWEVVHWRKESIL